jgi:hypothetical protein
MRQETPAVVAGNEAIRPSGGCASTAVRAARNYGAGRRDRIGSRPAACGHEDRQFEDGEHKTRPLETVGGMDVYVVQSLHGGPSESANDKLCRLLFFNRRAQGCRRGARHRRGALPLLRAKGSPHQAERSGDHPVCG